MSKAFYFKQFSLAKVLNLYLKTVLFQVIQFSIIKQFSSIQLIDRVPPGATTPGQSGPGSDGDERVLHILQSCLITGTSPSDCFVSYPGRALVVVVGGLTPRQRCSWCILLPQPTGPTVEEHFWYYLSQSRRGSGGSYLFQWYWS